MNILSIDEKELQFKIADLNPSYLYMSSQTAELLDKCYYQSFLLPQTTGYIGNYQGIPVHTDNSFPIGKIVFGVE